MIATSRQSIRAGCRDQRRLIYLSSCRAVLCAARQSQYSSKTWYLQRSDPFDFS